MADSAYRKNRRLADISLLYYVTRAVSVRVIGKNLFDNNAPPMVFTPDRPELGGLGLDERGIYISLMVKL